MRVVKGDWNGAFSRNNRKKVGPVSIGAWRWGEVSWLFNVAINDISVIYVTAMCRRIEEEVGPTYMYGRAPNATGMHLIIGRTQLSDVALFRALQTQICDICIQCRLLHEKLKPHRKNGQITANNKHLTVENVCPPYPPTKRTCGGSQVLQKLKLFPQK